jgi:hypothetical protein
MILAPRAEKIEEQNYHLNTHKKHMYTMYMYYVLLVFGLYFQVYYMRAKITLFPGFSA